MARYRKFDLRTWNDQKFRDLSPLPPSGQSLWIYLILGPQTTSIPGLFEASEVTLCDRLGWSVEAFRKAFLEASSMGMAKADWKARLVWLPNAPKYNKPESPNVVKSWGMIFDELPECSLKRQAYQSLKAFAEGWGEGYAEAFREAIREPSVKAMPNQEQEQEQEQKQEQEHAQSARANRRNPGDESRPADGPAPFERIKTTYPEFAGKQSDWLLAERACLQRIEEGATWEELEAGAIRFQAFVAAGGRSGPQYVDLPSKFYGNGLWREEWKPPPTKAEQRQAENIDAAQSWLRASGEQP